MTGTAKATTMTRQRLDTFLHLSRCAALRGTWGVCSRRRSIVESTVPTTCPGPGTYRGVPEVPRSSNTYSEASPGERRDPGKDPHRRGTTRLCSALPSHVCQDRAKLRTTLPGGGDSPQFSENTERSSVCTCTRTRQWSNTAYLDCLPRPVKRRQTHRDHRRRSLGICDHLPSAAARSALLLASRRSVDHARLYYTPEHASCRTNQSTSSTCPEKKTNEGKKKGKMRGK